MRSSFVQRLKNQKYQTLPTRESQGRSVQHSEKRPTSFKNPKAQLNHNTADIEKLLSILDVIKNPQFYGNIRKLQQTQNTQQKTQNPRTIKTQHRKKQNVIKFHRKASSQFSLDLKNSKNTSLNPGQIDLFGNFQRKGQQNSEINFPHVQEFNTSLHNIGGYRFPTKNKINDFSIKVPMNPKEKLQMQQVQKQQKSLPRKQSTSFYKAKQKQPSEIRGKSIEKVVNKSLPNIPVGKQKKRGLQNIGNTCYINSIVQCLFHISSFNDYFLKEKYLEESTLKGQKFNSDRSIVQKYRQLHAYVMKGEIQKGEEKKSTFPLKQALANSCSLFLDWQQQDAHEFLRKLIDSMHQQLNRIATASPYKLLKTRTNLKNSSITALADQYFTYYQQKDDSFIYDTFGGQLYNNISCINCKNQSISFENSLDLSLPIVNGKNQLKQLLGQFFGEEKLCDYYKCEYCGQTNKYSSKTTNFWRTPEILIIQLKRSQFGKKNQEPIKFPVDLLNLKQFINNQSDQSSGKYANYTLKGVVSHRGAKQNGHYWAVIKDLGQWYEADDEKVSKLSQEEIRKQFEVEGSSEAYMLFYESMYR